MSDAVERAEMYLGFIDPYTPWEADTPALGGPWHVYAADSHKAICVDGATASFVAAAPDVMRELVAEVKTSRQSALEWSRVCRENCRAVVDAEAERDDALAEVKHLRAQVERMRTCR